MEESPFRDNWSWFGFDGEPDSQIDYSWFRVQDSLVFNGINNVITDCSIFYSSKKPKQYLIKSPGIADELWDSSDCSFRLIPEMPSGIEVTSERRMFLIIGASSSLIEIFVRDRKLPANTAQGFLVQETLPVKYTRTTIRRERSPSLERLE